MLRCKGLKLKLKVKAEVKAKAEAEVGNFSCHILLSITEETLNLPNFNVLTLMFYVHIVN